MTRHQDLAVVREWPRLLHRLIARVVVDVVQARCLLRCATCRIASVIAGTRVDGRGCCRRKQGAHWDRVHIVEHNRLRRAIVHHRVGVVAGVGNLQNPAARHPLRHAEAVVIRHRLVVIAGIEAIDHRRRDIRLRSAGVAIGVGIQLERADAFQRVTAEALQVGVSNILRLRELAGHVHDRIMEAVHAHSTTQNRVAILEHIEREPNPRLKVDRRCAYAGVRNGRSNRVPRDARQRIRRRVIFRRVERRVPDRSSIPCASCHAPSLLCARHTSRQSSTLRATYPSRRSPCSRSTDWYRD